MSDKNREKLTLALAKKDETENAVRTIRKLETLKKLETNEKGECPKKLDQLALALALLLKKTKRKWLMKDSPDGFPEFWFVTKILYEPPSRHRDKAAVKMEMCAVKRGKIETSNCYFHRRDITETQGFID